jgi:putative sigma-54 modulation protein
MKITFTGKQDTLTASQERKLALAFGRLSKHLDRRGEKVAQVILSTERHLKQAEVRMNYYGHTIIGRGADSDQFISIMAAVDKIEKQVLKNREKWRGTKRETPSRAARVSGVSPIMEEPVPPEAARGRASRPARIVRAAAKSNGKPMTFDEAVLAIEEGRDYVVYRDASSDEVRVLIKRSDGKVDLVEA